MNYLLLFLLILEVLIIYNLDGKNVVSPAFISCCCFIFSTSILILSNDYFQYELSLTTIITIISLIVCIALGEVVANNIRINVRHGSYRKNVNNNMVQEYSLIIIPKYVIFLMLLFVTVTGAIYFFDAYKYSLSIGNVAGNFFGVAEYTRFKGSYSPSTFISQANVLSECIMYFCFYSYAHNVIFCKTKKIYYILPLFGFLFHIMANNGRSAMIKYICICCIMYFAMYKQNTLWRKGNNKKIFRIGILAVIVFLVAFRILGYRTGASVNNELWDNLAEYISSGLVGLDQYLINGQSNNSIFGQEIFKALYASLRGWGISIPDYDSNDLYFTFAGGRSNVYTGLKGYIQDFSFVGATISMFVLGYFITSLKNRMSRNGTSLTNTYLLGLMYYPVAMLSIAGATHMVLCMPTVYALIYIKLLILVFERRQINNRVLQNNKQTN